MLTQSRLQELFEYKEGKLYWKIKRQGKEVGDVASFKQSAGYLSVSIERKAYLEHRLIFMFFHGYFPKEIDHINRNRTDNRIENLREVTRQENCFNASIKSNNKSGIPNVYWNKTNKNWNVRISINKVYKHIGCFYDIELAKLAAIEAKNKYQRIG